MIPQDRLALLLTLALLAGSATSCTSLSAMSVPTSSSLTIEELDVTQVNVTPASLAPPTPDLPDVQPAQLFDQALMGIAKISEKCEKDPTSSNPCWGKLELIKDIALKMAEVGEVDRSLQALSYLKNLYEKEQRGVVLADIASKLSNQKQPNRASEIFQQALEIAQVKAVSVKSTTEGVNVLLDLSTKMIEGGQRELALKALSSAIQIAETSKGDEEYTDYGYPKTYKDTLVINLAKTGQFEQALQIAQTIPPSVARVKAWVGVAVELAANGQIDRAEKLLSDAMNLAQSLSGGYTSNGSCYIEKSDALQLVVDGLAQVHQIQKAATIAKGIRNCSGASSPDITTIDYRGDAYANVIKQLTNDAETKAVLQSIQSWDDPNSSNAYDGEKYRVLAEVALKLAEQGKFDQAAQVVKTIKEIPATNVGAANLTFQALSMLSIKFAAQGKVEPAFEIIKKLQDNSRRSYPLPEKDNLILLIQVGDRLIRAGRSQEGITLFSQAFQLGQKIRSPNSEPYDLRYPVIIAFLDAGQVNIATQLMRKTLSESNRTAYPPELAVSFAKAGQFKLALQIAQGDDRALASVAVELSKYQARRPTPKSGQKM